jgi:3-oxoacyl-(acyl-carrier-protein) synthase
MLSGTGTQMNGAIEAEAIRTMLGAHRRPAGG